MLKSQVSGNLSTTTENIYGINNTSGEGFDLFFLQNQPTVMQIEPEYIAVPVGQYATPIFTYNQNNNQYLGLQAEYVLGKVIYTTFGLEGIDWDFDMSLPHYWLTRVMFYFGNTTSNDEILKPQSDRLTINAYPNPFNAVSNIEISSKSATSSADIEIFNSKGQRVHQQSIQLNNGKSSYSWNGKDLTGKNCSNGIYFIKVNNGNQTHTKKVLRFK